MESRDDQLSLPLLKKGDDNGKKSDVDNKAVEKVVYDLNATRHAKARDALIENLRKSGLVKE